MASKIELQLDQAGLFAWQETLVSHLRQQGHLLRCKLVRAGRDEFGAVMPDYFDRVRALEARFFDRSAPRLNAVDRGVFAQSDFDGEADFGFNLSGLPGELECAEAQDYAFFFNGSQDFRVGYAALIEEQAPLMELMQGDRVVTALLPAIDRKNLFADSWQSIVEHMMMVVCSVVAGSYLPSNCTSAAGDGPSEIGALSLPAFFARQFGKKVRERLRRRAWHQDHWQVGYRRIEGPGVLDTHEWPEEDYIWLPDDGQRYYADPFVFRHGEATYLFVEEFRYANQKGILAVATLQEDGTFSKPEPILALPYHLSYPLVFEQDGEIYMMPESCENKTLDIFRAQNFPHDWVLDRTLLDNVEIADVTPVDFEGETYLFANGREGFVRSWAGLHIYKGPSRLGPFERLLDGPALIDAGSARAGGHMRVVDGAIERVVQDGRGGYGAALLIARVSKLGPDGFEQHIEKLLRAKSSWGISGGEALGFTGVHTLNRAHGFEVIDARRWRKRT